MLGDLKEKTQIMAELLAVGLNCDSPGLFRLCLPPPHRPMSFPTWVYPMECTRPAMMDIGIGFDGLLNTKWMSSRPSLDVLKAPHPTGGTLLERGCVYGTTEYGEGWRHGTKELPGITAGSAGGRMNTGLHLVVPGGNLARAHPTALKGVGLGLEQFGHNGAETNDVLPGIPRDSLHHHLFHCLLGCL